MALLKTVDSKFFHSDIPHKPMGKYVSLTQKSRQSI